MEGVAVGDEGPNGLEDLISTLFVVSLTKALTSSLPSLPLPHLAPATFADFGIPEGTLLGVVNGVPSNTVRSWLADGTLGEVGAPEPLNEADGLCTNTCRFERDGACDDGGPDSSFSVCAFGSDCADCGPRPPIE